ASERESNRCRVGYVTTSHHHARGIWSAELTRDGDRLSIRVRGTARPNTWLFWIGLPCARLLQKRAWRRAIEEFRSL
ncbi:DUF1990 family protein, partial [Klebsiella pneumoniae]|uniref:DUF1990 family protein n=1 Tax=Klebsiella pneumoniae TaxID=573 RepID=UPI003EDFE372